MRVQLFVTCLVDHLTPAVGEATVDLLERLGHEVVFDAAQTCCGQPAWNDGLPAEAEPLATRTVRLLARDPAPVVVPSGSCASMLRHGYPALLGQGPLGDEARAVAARTYELSQFLVEILGRTDVGATWRGRVAYHDSCHLARWLGVVTPPRRLLAAVDGLTLVELPHADTCCGFGGLFATRFPDVSAAILEDKCAAVVAANVDAVVAADGGCLMQITGGLRRRGSAVRALHLAEVLAGRP